MKTTKKKKNPSHLFPSCNIPFSFLLSDLREREREREREKKRERERDQIVKGDFFLKIILNQGDFLS